MNRRTLHASLPLGVAALVIGVAAPAFAAATVYNLGGGHWDYDGDGTNEVITPLCVSGNISPTPTVGDPMPCTSVTLISVNPLGGGDTVNLSAIDTNAFPNVVRTQINVGADLVADTITGSPYPDAVSAGPGDTVTTGDGNDEILGAASATAGDGDDILKDTSGGIGGNGNDRFVQSIGTQDIADGGNGDDTMEVDFNQGYFDASVDFMVDNAKIRVSVPGVGFSDLQMFNFEHLLLVLPNGGTQHLDASAFPGDLVVRGFGGPDIITGTKKTDYLNGGAGNDTIEARDGVADTVICGAGTDVARVDGNDIVSGCESITYAKPNTSAITGPGKIRKGGSGSFKFSSSVPGSAFQCKIDTKRWKACTSPFKVGGSTLSLGSHTLRVRAGYPAGNWDATPSKKAFKVVA